MEKSNKQCKYIFKRLLIFVSVVFLSGTNLWAQRKNTWEYISSLKFRKSEEYFFTQSDSAYILDIEDVSPENVTIYVNSLPQDVSLVSIRKESIVPTGGNPVTGTHITLWLRFDKAGFYRFNPIDMKVNKGYYRMKFEPAQVYENPRFILPQISVQFENEEFNNQRAKKTVKAGEHVVFTVYIKYALQIINFTWNLPENSLFNEVERYQITENTTRGNAFSPQAYPLATFDWQPLKDGKFDLPQILVNATTYNGQRVTVDFPVIKFNVEKSAFAQRMEEEKPFAFSYAFSEPIGSGNSNYDRDISYAELVELQELYKKERMSFPFSQTRKKRMEFERVHGLSGENYRASVPLLLIMVLMVVIFFVLTIVFVVLKINQGAAFFGVLTVLVISITTAFGIYTNRSCGIYCGGELSSIPEENISSGVTVPGGEVVFIKKKAGEWNYISYKTTNGWVKKDTVLVVK